MSLKNILLILVMAIVTALYSNALEIQSPENITYFTNAIQLNITSNQSLDNITYSLDKQLAVLACQNCTQFIQTFNLTFGNHTFDAFGQLGNKTFNDSVSFLIQEAADFSIEIAQPQNITYNLTSIEVNIIANKNLDNLSMKLDNENYKLLCQNCSGYSATINASEGNRTLYAKGVLEGLQKEVAVSFGVKIPAENTTENLTSLDLAINSPQMRIYSNKNILLNFSTNINATIAYVLDNQFYTACNYCTNFTRAVLLQNGQHSLLVNATNTSLFDSKSVNFTINQTTIFNDTHDNKTKLNKSIAPKFSKGFQKLPKMVASGEISDAELANIIRSNKLNPGIINRLIKTGRLGNESVQAILDTQFTPPGILKKLFGFFGFKQKSYSELIYEKYKLSPKLEQKVLERDEISYKYAKKVEEKFRNTTEQKIDGIEKEVKQKEKDNDKKIYKAGKQSGKPKEKLNGKGKGGNSNKNNGKGKSKKNN